ncbi:hypothetical protein D6825_02185 [Candidatus Woesearchaeota archaeon]|nr:MAG: hypothetical protein D6825_02185 [Candidatus Woesearchaeota archaeon]
MKTIWYLSITLLMLSVLAGFVSITPTNAVVVNLPPRWALPDQFEINGTLALNASQAFFDPDGDLVSLAATSSEGVRVALLSGQIIIEAEKDGTVKLTASDGKTLTQKELAIKAKQ